MKKFNRIIFVTLFCCILTLTILIIRINVINNNQDNQYKVEVNRLYLGLVEHKSFTKPNLSSYKYVKNVSFIDINSNNDTLNSFYNDSNNYNYVVKPYIYDNKLKGYLRFDYIKDDYTKLVIVSLIIGFGILLAVILTVLIYIKINLIKPFNRLSDIAYEMSKGNLHGDIKENKNKYFGKFIWGVNMLRDNLNYHKIKELKLEKEKKMLLLSISHDIKTPLNAINLYAKALENNIYECEEEKNKVTKQIQEKTIEIDKFVNEIIKSSSEDILEIEVNNTEFYLDKLISKVQENYSEKCKLRMIDFNIDKYDNKLIKGDLNRTYEVVGNILENAFKYGDGRLIKVSFYEEDYYQLIKIYNSGNKVSQNELIHLFDSFYRGSNTNNKEGNGLGLYICKHIMEKMDGEIFAQCEEEGMSFTLVLSM